MPNTPVPAQRPKDGARISKADIRAVVARVRNMSQAELTQTFVTAGIITRTGRLTKPYRHLGR